MHGRKQLSAQDYQHWIAKWIRNFCHYKLMAFGGILVWLWIIFALFFTINVINCQSLNHNTYVHRYYAAKSLHSCLTVRPHRRQPTRLPRPWDSPGKNTGVGCHFLLQCMKVKSESEVAQLCPTLSDPMDCSPPGFSAHGIFQARVLEWGAIAFSKLYS